MGYIIFDKRSIATDFTVLIITGSAGVYTIPGRYAIKRIYAKLSSGSNNLICGTTAGGNDLIDSTPLAAGVVVAIDTTIIAVTSTTVYFSVDTLDPTQTTSLTIYLDKI